MKLLYKPDFEQAARRWQAFWEGELIDRPPTVITVRREGAPARPGVGQLAGMDGDYDGAVDKFEAWAATMYFAGEAMPYFRPNFGDYQFAAFLGAEIVVLEDSGDVAWVEPFVEDWMEVVSLHIDSQNTYWQRMLDFCEIAGRRAAGKFLVATLDTAAHMDALAGIRGYERFCLDMIDQPELVDRLLAEVIEVFPVMYDAIFHTARMDEVGWTINWASLASPGKGEIQQCDFSAVMSPEMFRRWVRPALEAENEFLDHTFYHLDGPDALTHLPELLSIRNLHGIQWVPGAALEVEKPQHTWIDIFHRVQQAGKAVQIWGDSEAVKWVHPQLRPELVMYIASCSTPAETDELLAWLDQHS